MFTKTAIANPLTYKRDYRITTQYYPIIRELLNYHSVLSYNKGTIELPYVKGNIALHIYTVIASRLTYGETCLTIKRDSVTSFLKITGSLSGTKWASIYVVAGGELLQGLLSAEVGDGGGSCGSSSLGA